jgi:methylated-DNA-[protein]-cysteine S-methyltransferase
MREIPMGEVVTYGELAILAGNPRAARAAGHACAGNTVGLFVPCHRVVSASGLGGYGLGGSEIKRRLLEFEGADIP